MQDLALTIATSGATIVSLVLVTRWMARALSTEEFGVYSISRRVVSSVGVYASVLGLTLTRNIASTVDEDRRSAFVAATALAGVVPALLALCLSVVLARPAAALFFRSVAYGEVFVSAIGLVVATVIYSLIFARHRGRGQIRVASMWQLWAMGLGPAIVAYGWAGSRRIALVNWLTAFVMATAVIPLGLEVHRALRHRASRGMLGEAVAEMISYGAPRVPGGLAVGALLAVGPVLAPYFGSLAQAGYLVAGQSILRVVEGGTAAFGVVVLPKVISLRAAGGAVFVRERVEDILGMTLHLGLFLCWSLTLWAPEIVLAWLGPQYQPAIIVVRLILVAVVPYLAYALLRSVIDALDERAINAHNAYAALGATVGLSVLTGLLGYGVSGLAIAGATGFTLLGFLSARYLWQTLQLEGKGIALPSVLALNLGGLAIAASLRALLPSDWGAAARLATGIGIGLALGFSYVILLRQLKVRWVREIEARLFHNELAR
jgi:O-antigen/teichoic acid export membrane protein